MKFKRVENSVVMSMDLHPGKTQALAFPSGGLPGGLPAFSLKKILVPVDFSECTQEALLYAVPFAKQFKAELTLLHVVEPVTARYTEVGPVSPIHAESIQEVEQALRQLQERLADTVRCRTIARKGIPEQEIASVAEELRSDLIILSTHGRTGWARLLMGSVAERVVRHAGCPLLVVRPNEREFVSDGDTESASVKAEAEREIECEMVSGM